MGWVCSTECERVELHAWFWWGNPREMKRLEDLVEDER